MFGSDFPGEVSDGVAAIRDADFLSEEQKRDILCNNAARFLRLGAAVCQETPVAPERQMSRHHLNPIAAVLCRRFLFSPSRRLSWPASLPTDDSGHRRHQSIGSPELNL